LFDHYFGSYLLTFYIKFVRNYKSSLTKIKIFSEVSESNTQEIVNFEVPYLARNWSKF